MTRINIGIPPSQLSDKHLLAEHREIKRIPNHLLKYGWLSIQPKVPTKFCLGTGHVLFFINKGKYTFSRYKEIYYECIDREFNVTDFSGAWKIYNGYPNLYKDWVPTKEEIALIIKRLKDKAQ